MAYREPGVTVTQEFANAQPALATFSLPNVIVGPIFQIVKLASAGTYAGDEQQYGWAGKLAGALIDARPPRIDSPEGLADMAVSMTFKNTTVKLVGSLDAVVQASNLNRFTDATAGAFAGVKAEDKIVITSGTLSGTYTVRSKIDDNTLQIKETFSGAATAIEYDITRNIGVVAVPAAALIDINPIDGVTVDSGLQFSVEDFGSCQVKSADAYISYRALRLENSSDIKEYSSVAALQEDFGLDQIVPENPAVFGAYLALSNSVSSTNILGLKAEALLDEPMAYSMALEILSLTDMYAITVLSQNPAVHTLLKTHVEGMSVPAKKQERVGLINRALVLQSTVVAASSGSLAAPGTIVNCPGAHFITAGVVPGHFVKMTGPLQGRFKVAAVNSQTQLVLETAASSGAVASISFLIERDLTKTEQASVMAAYARSLGSRRLVMTYPDVVKVPVGNTIRALPGYFLNCAIGALTTGLPTQQGLTNL
ncbi:MAG: hypothetical protein EBV30_09710, partial [Actinobacteria bacterium]|nr:hypothetical protein [Actinomycetota bacterium]